MLSSVGNIYIYTYLGHLRKAIPVYGRTPRYSLDIFSLSLFL